MHIAVPPHTDDHDGSDAWCIAACAEQRNRLRAAPSAGHHNYRRIDHESDTHAFHNPGHVSLFRPPAKDAVKKNYQPTLLLVGVAAFAFLSGCVVGPKYHPPDAPVPLAFKESPPDGWKEAKPADGELRDNWWEMYDDRSLNALVEQVSISNQNVIAAEARYREAKAAARVA